MIFDKTKLAKTLTFAFVSALGISSLVPAAFAQEQGIAFTETEGPGGDTLTSSNPLAVITGTADNWNIDLSAPGIILDSQDLPQQKRH